MPVSILKNVRTIFSVLILVISLGGCSTVPEYVDPKGPPLKLSEITHESLAANLRDENAYRPSESPRRRIGLAMSGGGSKAGMFAHGVLHGLNESGLLNHIDVVSTTSGSNYPVFWYFTKHLEARQLGFDVRQIFDDCVPAWYGDPKDNDHFVVATVNQAVEWAKRTGYPVCNRRSHYLTDENGEDRLRWQAHLARWPDVFETDITIPTGNRQKSPWADTFWLGIRILGELPLTWLPIDSGIPVAYMRGIERTWGLNPFPRDPGTVDNDAISEAQKWKYSNAATTIFGALHVGPERAKWESLQELYLKNPKLPLWVMNTTEGQKKLHPNMNNLYEVTPFSYGSTRHEYHKGAPPMPSISYGVRASAAFFDRQGAVGFQKLAMGLADVLLPAATWGVKIDQPKPPSREDHIRLSDGGGADNLGLMSLLRRGLDQIIVVDTAQDVEGRMDDLCWDLQALDNEGYELSIPALKELEEVCKRGKAYNISEWKNPVLTGEIRPKQGVRAGAIDKVKLFWIKAAWNEYEVRNVANEINKRTPEGGEYLQAGYLGLCGNSPNQMNCWLPVHYAHNSGEATNGPECIKTRTDRGDESNDCFMDFPQLKTVNSTFSTSTYQFWAYRELARSLAIQLFLDDLGELRTRNPQCAQLPKEARKGKRPNDWNYETWKKNEGGCDTLM